MKKHLAAMLCLFCFAQCAYKVTRVGYQQGQMLGGNTNDTVLIAYQTDSLIDQLQPIGSIVLKDGGATVNCSEEDAIAFLKEEAWSIGANVVLLDNIKRADFLSSCFRCTAYFYYVEGNEATPKQDGTTKQSDANISFQQNEANSILWGVVAAVLGFVVGFLLFQ